MPLKIIWPLVGDGWFDAISWVRRWPLRCYVRVLAGLTRLVMGRRLIRQSTSATA